MRSGALLLRVERHRLADEAQRPECHVEAALARLGEGDEETRSQGQAVS